MYIKYIINLILIIIHFNLYSYNNYFGDINRRNLIILPINNIIIIISGNNKIGFRRVKVEPLEIKEIN